MSALHGMKKISPGSIMPKQYKRRVNRKRKPAMRRNYGKYGKSRGPRRFNGTQGYINVNRKCPMITIQDGGAPGAVSTNDPTGSCITLGIPTAVPGGIAGLYDVPFSMKFQLNHLTAFSEFTNLFDSYKINGVKVFFRCFYNTSSVTSVGLPSIEYITDHDDANPIGAIQMRERVGTRHKWFNATKNVISMYVKPKVADLVVSTAALGTTATGTNRGSQWLDSATPGVEHYSIKGVIRNMWLQGTAGLNQFQVDVMPNVSFKGIL